MCINYIDQMDKGNNFRFILLGTIVCVNYIDQMDKINNFRFTFQGPLCVLTLLIKWTKEKILGLYFLGTIVC